MIDELVVTVLKNIESAQGKPFLKSTTGPQRSRPPTKYTSKEVDRPPLFENCSSRSVTLCQVK